MAFFICSNCGYGSASWIGRCPECGQWNTFKKQSLIGNDKNIKNNEEFKIIKAEKIKSKTANKRLLTAIYDFNKTLGGGVFFNSVILLTGDPGIGKSTLLAQALKNLKTIYVSGEESIEQIKDRLERLDINLNNFYLSNNQEVEAIIQGLKNNLDNFEIVVIDSIQTLYSNKIDSPPGSIVQLKETALQLINFAKNHQKPVIIIGHITKEGEIAGPKTLEHFVDVVLSFEGEKSSHFRILRATKNRFGSTDEIGVFEMTEKGLKENNNPLLFVEKEKIEAPGMVLVGINEGSRPLFFEIQTLFVPSILTVPRRIVKGIDYNKFLLLLAVIRKYYHLPLDKFDVFLNVIGGINIKSPAADLGIIASLLSSYKNKPLPNNSVFIGEIGLLGEVRKTIFQEKTIIEAKRLGIKNIYSSVNIKNINQLKQLI